MHLSKVTDNSVIFYTIIICKNCRKIISFCLNEQKLDKENKIIYNVIGD